MTKLLQTAFLIFLISATPALAQTTGISGAGPANPQSTARLSAPTAVPSTASAVAPSGSGRSSPTGAATSSNSVPAWMLCPPSGASGIAPFLTGTGLSCAP